MLQYEIDEYMFDKRDRSATFEVDLSDGRTVYSDDDRPGLEIPSTWVRLRRYLYSTQLSITGYRLRFRSNVIHIGYNVDGYYFSKALLYSFGSEQSYNFIVAGTLNNNKLLISRYSNPSLQLEETEYREVNTDSECLIINPNITIMSQQDQHNT